VNGGAAAVITNNSGGTVQIQSQVIAANGFSFSGNNTTLFIGTSNQIAGTVTQGGSGNLFFYNPNTVNSASFVMSGAGSLRFGATTATNYAIASNFDLQGAGQVRSIFQNASGTAYLRLSGNITGDAGLDLQSGTPANTETRFDLTGVNTYAGNTVIESNVSFNNLRNFGEGSIAFRACYALFSGTEDQHSVESLGWQTAQKNTRPIIPAMSATRNGNFAQPI